MTPSTLLLVAFLIGVLAGFRALTPPAIIAWAVHLHWLRFDGTPLSFLHSTAALVILTLLALGELVGDKLPNTPSRTRLPGLVARVITGAFCGACVGVASHQALALGALAGAVGGIAGAFGGYQARVRLVKALGTPDFVVAALEDLVAIGGSLFLASRL